jgi:hypothetical protein
MIRSKAHIAPCLLCTCGQAPAAPAAEPRPMLLLLLLLLRLAA